MIFQEKNVSSGVNLRFKALSQVQTHMNGIRAAPTPVSEIVTTGELDLYPPNTATEPNMNAKEFNVHSRHDWTRSGEVLACCATLFP